MSKVKIITSAALTAVLSPLVRSYAVAHHTQWNFGVVLLLFAAILTIFAVVDQFRQLIAIGLGAGNDE